MLAATAQGQSQLRGQIVAPGEEPHPRSGLLEDLSRVLRALQWLSFGIVLPLAVMGTTAAVSAAAYTPRCPATQAENDPFDSRSTTTE